MNRLLSRFGKKIINEKLRSLQEIYNIEIIKVNPAYSSQECSSCGYVDRQNRKYTQEF
jgi:putative transposase